MCFQKMLWRCCKNCTVNFETYGAVENMCIVTSNEHNHDKVNNRQLAKDKIRNTCKWTICREYL